MNTSHTDNLFYDETWWPTHRSRYLERIRLLPFLAQTRTYMKVTSPSDFSDPLSKSLQDVDIELFPNFELLKTDFNYFSSRDLIGRMEMREEKGYPLMWYGLQEYVEATSDDIHNPLADITKIPWRWREHIYIVITKEELNELDHIASVNIWSY